METFILTLQWSQNHTRKKNSQLKHVYKSPYHFLWTMTKDFTMSLEKFTL
jgi:hypothetical protein